MKDIFDLRDFCPLLGLGETYHGAVPVSRTLLLPCDMRGPVASRRWELVGTVHDNPLPFPFVQKECGVSLTGDIPEPSEHNPLPMCSRMTLLRQGGGTP